MISFESQLLVANTLEKPITLVFHLRQLNEHTTSELE